MMLLQNDKGAVFIELAMVLPILLMLSFGVIEYMDIINKQQKMAQLSEITTKVASETCQDLIKHVEVRDCLQAAMDDSMNSILGLPNDFGSVGGIVVSYWRDPVSGPNSPDDSPNRWTKHRGTFFGRTDYKNTDADLIWLFNNRKVFFTSEVFYRYRTITPIGKLITSIFTTPVTLMYETSMS